MAAFDCSRSGDRMTQTHRACAMLTGDFKRWDADMATIDIKTETEGANNWAFEVEVCQGGKAHAFNVTLSWADYDLWSHGRVAPQRVVAAAFEFLLEREPLDSILKKFDCSLIRRYFSEVDQALPKLI